MEILIQSSVSLSVIVCIVGKNPISRNVIDRFSLFNIQMISNGYDNQPVSPNSVNFTMIAASVLYSALYMPAAPTGL